MSAPARQGGSLDVVRVLSPLRDGPSGRLDIRILEVRRGDRRVDIRQYVASGGFTGYTRKGICLTAEEFDALLEQRDEIAAALEGRSRTRAPRRRSAARTADGSRAPTAAAPA